MWHVIVCEVLRWFRRLTLGRLPIPSYNEMRFFSRCVQQMVYGVSFCIYLFFVDVIFANWRHSWWSALHYDPPRRFPLVVSVVHVCTLELARLVRFLISGAWWAILFVFLDGSSKWLGFAIFHWSWLSVSLPVVSDVFFVSVTPFSLCDIPFGRFIVVIDGHLYALIEFRSWPTQTFVILERAFLVQWIDIVFRTSFLWIVREWFWYKLMWNHPSAQVISCF